MDGKSKLRGLLPPVSRRQYERDRRVPADSDRVAGLLILRWYAAGANDFGSPALRRPSEKIARSKFARTTGIGPRPLHLG